MVVMKSVGTAVGLEGKAGINGSSYAGSTARDHLSSDKEDEDGDGGNEIGLVSPVAFKGDYGSGTGRHLVPIDGLPLEMDTAWTV